MLKAHKEFQYIYNKGKSSHTNSVVLFYFSKNNIKKIGFTATKKIGNAVRRNRSKRRLRSLFIQYSPLLKDGSYIFVAKQSTSQIPFKDLEHDFKKVLTRAKCFT